MASVTKVVTGLADYIQIRLKSLIMKQEKSEFMLIICFNVAGLLLTIFWATLIACKFRDPWAGNSER